MRASVDLQRGWRDGKYASFVVEDVVLADVGQRALADGVATCLDVFASCALQGAAVEHRGLLIATFESGHLIAECRIDFTVDLGFVIGTHEEGCRSNAEVSSLIAEYVVLAFALVEGYRTLFDAVAASADLFTRLANQCAVVQHLAGTVLGFQATDLITQRRVEVAVDLAVVISGYGQGGGGNGQLAVDKLQNVVTALVIVQADAALIYGVAGGTHVFAGFTAKGAGVEYRCHCVAVLQARDTTSQGRVGIAIDFRRVLRLNGQGRRGDLQRAVDILEGVVAAQAVVQREAALVDGVLADIFTGLTIKIALKQLSAGVTQFCLADLVVQARVIVTVDFVLVVGGHGQLCRGHGQGGGVVLQFIALLGKCIAAQATLDRVLADIGVLGCGCRWRGLGDTGPTQLSVNILVQPTYLFHA
ncbi:hypothetical protein D3C77_390830 [compost metagenome]